MAYRFNMGRGGVTCDICNKLIDADLGLEEYEESYGKSGHDGDFCVRCLNPNAFKKKLDKTKKDDIVDDGWRN